MHDLLRDMRFAIRTIRKNPGFATVVILTLALGIGFNTAIFSVVDGILLRPLPYPDEEELVSVWADYTGRDGPLREWLSYPNFHDLRGEQDVFDELGVYVGWGPTLTGFLEPVQLTGANVTAGMFADVLGVAPMIGRGFLPEDDTPGAPNVVLLSYGFWSRVTGANPSIVGSTIDLSMQPYTVIGVMPPGFKPPFLPDADVWQTMKLDMASTADQRGSAFLRSVGRLRDGVTVEMARDRAQTLGARLAKVFPDANVGIGYAIFPLRSDVVRTASAALFALLGAVTVVLLIACVNVANLMLARTAARQSELAVRAAVGAGGGRIAKQILTESAVLAALGGTLGLIAAFIGTDLLKKLAPVGTPRIDEVVVDARVLLFAIVVTGVAGMLFGVLPALRVARADLHDSLKEGGRSGGFGLRSARLRNALVVGQVALALLLIVGAGLFVRTLAELNRLDPGFDAPNKLTLQLGLPAARYPDRAASRAFYADLENRLRAVPGVTSVASINSLPLSGFDGDSDFKLEGQPPPPPGKEHVAWIRRVTPGYFETMGISVTGGRDFTAGDDENAPLVVMINSTMAERFYADRDPVGMRLYFGDPENPIYRDIVGVVKDVKNFGLRSGSRNAIYFPFAQVAVSNMFVVIETVNAPESMAATVRRVLAEIDPGLAAGNVSSMSSVVNQSLGPERFNAMLFSLFAILAFVLAAVGLYGVVSYNVNQRMREMGLRIALGAEGGDIRRLVITKILVLVGMGIAVGIAGSFAIGRLVQGLLFGVGATDPLTFGVAALLLAGVAVLAGALPARRASRVDPVTVLKAD